MSKYGEPWRMESDWTVEIWDANGQIVGKVVYPDRLPDARRIVACVNACSGLSDSALDAGVVGKVREALETALGFVAVWGGRYQAEYGLDDVHPKHQEALEQVQAALSLLSQEDK